MFLCFMQQELEEIKAGFLIIFRLFTHFPGFLVKYGDKHTIGMVDKGNLHDEKAGSNVDMNKEQSLVDSMVGTESHITDNKISTVGPVEETVKPEVLRDNDDFGFNLEPLW